MPQKNGSPPRLTASAEAAAQADHAEARPSARTSSQDETTFMHNRRQAQDQLLAPEAERTPRGMLDRSLQAQLGRQLRAIYSDVADEPVPDRFVKLLEELETKEKDKENRQ